MLSHGPGAATGSVPQSSRSSGFQTTASVVTVSYAPVAAELQGVCLGPPAHRTGLYVVPQSKAGQGEVGGKKKKKQKEQSCGCFKIECSKEDVVWQ